MNLLTSKEAKLLQKTVPERECYNVGELFPTIFAEDETRNFHLGMPLIAKILGLGQYRLKSSIFPRIKCPVCGKEEALIPYFCGASVLSGCHVIKFYCTECHEKIAVNNQLDYFHKIRDHIIKNGLDINKIGSNRFVII
ncbi:MAG: hypothetical protein K6E29_09695 [Cyanobacteria bacterium RUI128]|nr:hypothetical protein [Cyanobacteria bacterium RUI128]